MAIYYTCAGDHGDLLYLHRRVTTQWANSPEMRGRRTFIPFLLPCKQAETRAESGRLAQDWGYSPGGFTMAVGMRGWQLAWGQSWLWEILLSYFRLEKEKFLWDNHALPLFEEAVCAVFNLGRRNLPDSGETTDSRNIAVIQREDSLCNALSGEVILRIATEPVLPFNALDIALEVQNSLKGDLPGADQLLVLASRLRESAELFQSEEMRPANDPEERAPSRVRMLNDVLQHMERSFLVGQVPPGFYRNILYHLDEKKSQFSTLVEAWEHCKPLASNKTLQEALSEVLNSINSAQVYFKAGLDVFKSVLVGKN
ncbi:inactive N-acetylated-alpha-linked acidic dipeptidase-like protein 2 [Nycticebus coucang]|uniref:inactive N-acetylated-alpha-linked acidic dipeptidase-like protein 2 n=1 Tax=Nycticebus coucang TaxID=9470 RepID=UPI00234C848F|nr:inactive N-acetylated-alpha-linked acidic dipeptidase-like protein 2 [Nycticebus coucang]